MAMHSVNSFNRYGKPDEAENQLFRQKTRKRMIILIVSSIVLGVLVVTAVAGTLIHKHDTPSSYSAPSSPELTPASSIKAVCDVTRYPNSCISGISSHPSYSNTTDPEMLFMFSLRVAIDELSKLAAYPTKLRGSEKDQSIQMALDVCGNVLEDAVDRLNDSISLLELGGGEAILTPEKIDDLRTWLSATVTDQETCLDAIEELNSTVAQEILRDMRTAMENATESSSNSLAIVTKILRVLAKVHLPLHRRLLGSSYPEWVGPTERRLLQQEANRTTMADAVVAKDGTGQYRTINEAVAAVKKKSESRFVIYVKEGVYVENVELKKDMWNVMIIGDGKNKTVISDSRNSVDGAPTFDTATFAVSGKGFIAKDIGFVNNAGPAKHQAVAMRSGSDKSVFYRCSFNAFQDTLYAHSNRQFYRECDITGTIDFIFGNAASVFQNCTIIPREPFPGQFNTVTAQGKTDPNQNTGIVIHDCSISALDNLTASTYLGRPWKNYSTIVVMKSEIGAFLDPMGWSEWSTDVEAPSTIFYAEYQNTGPGSNVTQRVRWEGYKPNLSEDEARKFSVGSFIHASQWLPDTGVEFQSSL
ncbi:hypothetical protein K1719_026874 [Acacia pycnantha]|nr:hypothetical protein K1719_026874 [Acacia pycnantha]